MKKLIPVLLILCLAVTMLPTTALAADKTLTLTEDWRLTSDLDLNVSVDDTLIIDGANRYYIYEMGGALQNNGGGTVYLKDTFVYAAGDNPAEDSLAALSQAARGVTVAAPAKDATALTLPAIAGYGVNIKSSSNTSVISTNGSVIPPSSATTVTLVLTLTDAAGNKADTANIQITVPAKTPGGSGTPTPEPTGSPSPSTPTPAPNGGGSSTPTSAPSIPGTGGVTVNYTKSGGDVTLALPDDKITEIIGKSNGKATFDLSGVSDATAAVLPKTALDTLAKGGLDVEVGLPKGTVKLDTAALQSVISAAQDANVSVAVKTVAVSSLNAAQQATVETGDKVVDISILSGTQNITSFDGVITATPPYTGSIPVSVWHLTSDGTLEKLTSSYDEGSKTVSFALPGHLSLYVLGQDTSVPAWVNPFTDISKSDWFYGDVEFAVKNGLFNGTTTTTFSPDMSMTRGMLVTALGRLHGVDTGKYAASSFEDVAAGKFYTPYVEWAKETGIVNGVGNNRFAPDNAISRQDLAVIVVRYAEYAGKQFPAAQQDVTFTDAAAIRDSAKSAVQTLYSNGIFQGDNNNRFNPQDSTTRAQVSAILHRFVEKVQ